MIDTIHGTHEWQTFHYLVNFMRCLLNPELTPYPAVMSQLRTAFSFYFIPLGNPYGYINGTRQNANGIDLNRNFDFMWEEYEAGDTEGDHTYRGPSPFSEPESQMIRDTVWNVKPVHNQNWHTWGGDRTNKMGKFSNLQPGMEGFEQMYFDLKSTFELNTGYFFPFLLTEAEDQRRAIGRRNKFLLRATGFAR